MILRIGRFLFDNFKKNEYRIRMLDDEFEIFNYCCKELKFIKVDVVRLGIKKVYDELEK